MKTLVCIMCQVRTAQLTWPSFKQYVLDALGADLALCIGDSVPRSDGKIITTEYSEDNGYFHNAKHIWRYTEPIEWDTAFDEMTGGIWRQFRDVPGNWLGPTKTHNGTGGINSFFRWFLAQKLRDEDMYSLYDQIIITRSDYYWIKPHPILDTDHVWIPNGEFHGGVCDRHAVFPSKWAHEFLINPLSPELKNPLIQFYNSRPWGASWMLNNESYLFFTYAIRNLHEKIGFFPFRMFTVSIPSPNQSGVNTENPKYPGLLIRYPDELEDAEADDERLITWPWRIHHTHISPNGFFKGSVTKI
jgi:hypothetical protein